LVDQELLRAIRTESALAIRQCWGVISTTAWRWRQAFGVDHLGTPGSKLLHWVTSERGAEARRGQNVSAEEIARRVATRKAKGGYVMPMRWAEKGWKPEEIALLGTMADEQLALKIGRSPSAVRSFRFRLGIPPFKGSPDTTSGG
jgi:hypothetical protein